MGLGACHRRECCHACTCRPKQRPCKQPFQQEQSCAPRPNAPLAPAAAQAAQASPELAAATAARHAQLLLRQGDPSAAAATLAARGGGAAGDAAQLAVYRDVALEVLGLSQAARSPQAERDVRSVAAARAGGVGVGMLPLHSQAAAALAGCALWLGALGGGS